LWQKPRQLYGSQVKQMLGGRRYRVARFHLYLRARRPGAEFSSFYYLTKYQFAIYYPS
jgi:hypothetical protein